MGWEATRWAHRRSVVASLDATKRGILWAAAPWSIDDTGWLPHERDWLAEHSGMSERTLERHMPPLEKLEYLVRGEKGFRLPAYLRDRQIGGIRPASPRQIAEKEKERTKEKEKANTEITLYQESSSPAKRETIHPQSLAVLALFEALPYTAPTGSKADQVEAELWILKGYSLASIGAALIVGISRHIASGGEHTPEPVGSLRFFRQVVMEFSGVDSALFRAMPVARMAAHKLGQLPDLARRKQEFYARVVAQIR